MDLLFTILVAGMAVGYTTELLSMIFPSRFVKPLLTVPLATLANWLLGLTNYELAVAAPASGFFALFILSIINRPVVVNNSLRR